MFDFAKTHTIDNRGMVQRIRYNRIVFAEQRFEKPAVRVETRAVKNRIFRSEILGYLSFELLVQILRTADKTNGRHAVPTMIHRLFSRFDKARMIREAKIIVRTEVQHFFSFIHANIRLLGRLDNPFLLV